MAKYLYTQTFERFYSRDPKEKQEITVEFESDVDMSEADPDIEAWDHAKQEAFYKTHDRWFPTPNGDCHWSSWVEKGQYKKIGTPLSAVRFQLDEIKVNLPLEVEIEGVTFVITRRPVGLYASAHYTLKNGDRRTDYTPGAKNYPMPECHENSFVYGWIAGKLGMIKAMREG